MQHTYTITGMTCSGCQAKVQRALSEVPGIEQADIDLQTGRAILTMTTHVPSKALQQALAPYPKYQLSDWTGAVQSANPMDAEQKTWLQTYKPILLVFAFILGITLLIERDGFQWMRWMNHFMAGFFLVFSFFKLLDIRGFADSYLSYDIVARRWNGWGFVYPFVELSLGIAYLIHFDPVVTNAVTFVVMSVSLMGVLRSVLQKRKIRCACLGAVFDLPMSTITIIEDALMIVMSAVMLIQFL